MKNILVIGAGRSSLVLIKYLLDNSVENCWHVTVADFSINLAVDAVKSHKNGEAISFDINRDDERLKQINKSDIVISMLPASLHFIVAKDCVRLKKNLVTASYVSKEISKLNQDAKKAGILLLNEIGLDPGIDHMSAMSIIDSIKDNGGELTSFKSYCGGLIHPDSDTNPWNYKFTWNPRNVVLAGQGTAHYIENSNLKSIAYNNLFQRTNTVNVLNAGIFESYFNRDSLSYRKSYGLDNIPTLYRGTLRRVGFCASWNMFVQLGLTDDSYKIENSENLSNRQFINMFLEFDSELTVEEKFCKLFNLSFESLIFKKIAWLGIFSEFKVGIKCASPAQILQLILESKWGLDSNDRDMIVMQHQFEFHLKGTLKKLNSSLLVYGDSTRYTSMAKTVGLPVAIATKLILNGIIKSTGVRIPTSKNIYVPVLEELKDNGINFIEESV